jgi:uncharacterized protein (DUF362 family)
VKSPVAVLQTSPDQVLSDYSRLLDLLNYQKYLDKKKPLVIKLNLSWTKFYPACSTWAWQLEGVIKKLLDDGWKPERIIPIEHRTVVTDVKKGAANNGWLDVLSKYDIRIRYLPDEKWTRYQPKAKMLVINQVFPQGILLPEVIFDANILHLPTMKMHVFTTITGAMKNAYGLLTEHRHWGHRFIHHMLVDLLTIQKEICSGYLAVMDGTTVGTGSGPRAMDWQIRNFLLASPDAVALDSTAARMMGFAPEKLEFLKKAAELDLGELASNQIEYLGNDISQENFGLTTADTFASRGQKLIYHRFPHWLEKALLQSPIVPWAYFASNFYHDTYWYNLIGHQRIKKFMKSPWGQLAQKYLNQVTYCTSPQ